MQNTLGENIGQSTQSKPTMLSTAISLQKKGGWKIFFDGIVPKLLRASVNHSVTFYIYEAIMKSTS